jgi:hypothetical protein
MKKVIICSASILSLILVVLMIICFKKEKSEQKHQFVSLHELELLDSIFARQLDSIVIRSPYYSKNGKCTTFTIGFFDNGENNLTFIVCEEEMYHINEYIDEYCGIFTVNGRYEFFVSKSGFPVGLFLDTGRKRNFNMLPKPRPIINDPPSWMIMYYKGKMSLIGGGSVHQRL